MPPSRPSSPTQIRYHPCPSDRAQDASPAHTPPPSSSSNPSSSPRCCLASAIDPAIASKHAPPSASSNPSYSPLGWPPAQAEGSGGDTGGRRFLDWASDEFSCYSGSSSSSSYSGASARSCVSDSAPRGRPVDPLHVLSIVASLHRINPKMFAEATGALFHKDQSERSSTVASEGSIVMAATSAGSTATSGRCRWPPQPSGGGGGGGEKAPRREEAIMQWFSRSQAGPATENDICAAVGNNFGTSKAIRWLLKQEGGLRRAGTGGLLDPYVYMVCEIRAEYLN
uniref:Uncharacterized protein n=1 Tax=Setaria italica TaxID=4555 RepID=K3ZER8_SETIT